MFVKKRNGKIWRGDGEINIFMDMGHRFFSVGLEGIDTQPEFRSFLKELFDWSYSLIPYKKTSAGLATLAEALMMLLYPVSP